MSFAKEIEDFLNGYQAVSSIAGDAEDRRMKRERYERQKAEEEERDMNTLAIDAEEYLPGSVKAARRRAPKTSTTMASSDVAVDLTEPYPDLDEGVSMAGGGLVPSMNDEEEPRAALPIDNPEAAKARAEGKTSYSAGNERRSLVAMNGKARNTYADVETPKNTDEEGRTPRSVGPGLKDIFGKADEAIRVAFNSFKQDIGQRSAIGGGREIDISTGRGAATPAEVKAIDQKIDPNNEMDPWVRGRARLGYAYDYFISRGEPEKAANVAKRLLLFDKMASQTRGKIAVQLLSSGQGEKAASVIADAYNDNIHDGSTLEVTPAGKGQFAYKVSKDGEIVDEGVATSEDLAALASSVADGSEFVRRTSAIAAGPSDEGKVAGAPASGSEGSAPAAAIPEEGAAPAGPGETAPPKAEDAPKKPKGKRDIQWAKRQYQYAAGVVKYWEDAVAEDPSEANKARLKDARIRLQEAEQDAVKVRLSTLKKGADQSQILLSFDKDLSKWREDAEIPEEAPPEPKDGLRGAPKKAAPAVEAVPTGGASPAQPSSPAANTGAARYLGYRSGGSAWDAGDGQMVTGPNPKSLKPTPAEIQAQARAAMQAGAPRREVVRKLLEQGFDPSGL